MPLIILQFTKLEKKDLPFVIKKNNFKTFCGTIGFFGNVKNSWIMLKDFSSLERSAK